MKINERVSDERLSIIKSWRETYGQDANVMIPASEAESIISELQQYRATAEPVAYIIQDAEARDRGRPGFLSYDGSISDEDINEYEISITPLYAAPQVTSVPDKWPEKLTWSHHDDMTQAEVLAWNNAIDACRAAMLNGGK